MLEFKPLHENILKILETLQIFRGENDQTLTAKVSELLCREVSVSEIESFCNGTSLNIEIFIVLCLSLGLPPVVVLKLAENNFKLCLTKHDSVAKMYRYSKFLLPFDPVEIVRSFFIFRMALTISLKKLRSALSKNFSLVFKPSYFDPKKKVDRKIDLLLFYQINFCLGVTCSQAIFRLSEGGYVKTRPEREVLREALIMANQQVMLGESKDMSKTEPVDQSDLDRFIIFLNSNNSC